MGGFTPDKGYPFPVGTDRVMDGDDAIHALAQTVDFSIQAGVVNFTTVADTNVIVAVTFPHAYQAVPVVVLGFGAGPPAGNYSQLFWAQVLSTTGFQAATKRVNAQTVAAYWTAIGKPV